MGKEFHFYRMNNFGGEWWLLQGIMNIFNTTEQHTENE